MNPSTTKLPVMRQFPNAIPFMRFQVGYNHDRPASLPIFAPFGNHIIGYKQGPLVTVFHLSGYGETATKALLKAGVGVADITSSVTAL